MPKYLTVAQKGDKKKVAIIEPKQGTTIAQLQDHLMSLGVSITFKEITDDNKVDGLVFRDLAGSITEGELEL